MIKLFASVCIEAPAEVVWAQLAKLAGHPNFRSCQQDVSAGLRT